MYGMFENCFKQKRTCKDSDVQCEGTHGLTNKGNYDELVDISLIFIVYCSSICIKNWAK